MKKNRLVSTAIAGTLAAAILVGGGTFAYLKANTEPVTNTFTAQTVEVSLAETTGNTYTILPGSESAKDPKVTVPSNVNVDSFVFVKVDDTTKGAVTWNIADGWTPVDGTTNVYSRAVTASNEDQIFDVLKDNKVTYSADLENGVGDKTTLSFTAYLIQQNGFDNATAAWEETQK